MLPPSLDELLAASRSSSDKLAGSLDILAASTNNLPRVAKTTRRQHGIAILSALVLSRPLQFKTSFFSKALHFNIWDNAHISMDKALGTGERVQHAKQYTLTQWRASYTGATSCRRS